MEPFSIITEISLLEVTTYSLNVSFSCQNDVFTIYAMRYYNRAAMKAFLWSPVTILLVIVVCVQNVIQFDLICKTAQTHFYPDSGWS